MKTDSLLLVTSLRIWTDCWAVQPVKAAAQAGVFPLTARDVETCPNVSDLALAT